MKKRMILFLSVSLLAALLTGCGTTSREQELKEQVAQLEQQIADMQDGTGDASASNTENTATDTSAADTTIDSSASDTTTNAAANTDDFDTLSQKIADAIAAADTAQPSGTAEENHSLFFTHKTTLDALDRELNAYEDNLETQYQNGTLNYTNFRQQDREVEKLEDDLDNAEDRLENRFGIDD